MSDPSPPEDWASIREGLTGRVRQIRRELYGEHGGPLLAGRLGLSHARWAAFEQGEPIPGDVILAFLAVTGAEPHWLLTGEGPRYRGRP